MSCGEPPLGRSGGSLWVQGRNPDLIPLIAGHRAQKRGGVPYILTPKENEQAPVIPLCNCCASTRRPIETGPIFRNSFMTFLTHMQFHGLKTKIPALLEFMLGSSFLIFPFLLWADARAPWSAGSVVGATVAMSMDSGRCSRWLAAQSRFVRVSCHWTSPWRCRRCSKRLLAPARPTIGTNTPV